MKTLKKFSLLQIMILSISLCFSQTTKNMDVASFDKIFVLGNIDVLLIKGDKESVAINFDGADNESVITEVVKNTLKIRKKPHFNENIKITVVVTYKTIRKISSHTGGLIETKGTIEGDHLELKAYTGGEIKLDVSHNKIKLNVAEGSKIFISGITSSIDINTNTGAHLLADKLDCETVIANINTGGNAKIKVSKSLVATVNTGGTLDYKGSPEVKNINSKFGGMVINEE